MPQITDRVYHIRTQLFVNMYLIKNDDGYTLVDTGTPGKAPIHAIEKALHDLNATWNDIHTIFITHAHIDHIGTLHDIQSRTQAITCVHHADAPIIQGKQTPALANPLDLGIGGRILWRVLQNQPIATPAEVNTTLEDGALLETIAPNAQAVHLPGHSYGQTGLWLPDEGTLIGGDVMMHFPWGLTHPIRVVSPDWADVRHSIERVAALAPTNLCLGHGNPILGNATQAVARFQEKLQH